MSRRFDKFVTKAKDAFSRAGGKERREDATGRMAMRPPTSLSSSIQPGSSSSAAVRDKSKEDGAIREGSTDLESDIDGAHGAPSLAEGGPGPAMEPPSGATPLVTEPREVTGGAAPMPIASKGTSVASAPSGTTQAPGRLGERTTASSATSSTTEDFGLFPFPPRTGADYAGSRPLESFENDTASSGSLQHVDIIVVHGVGGHWTNTWQASDDTIWPRDRIPDLFSDTDIRCRIRSFGYNSASFFTRSDVDIRECAKDLIDRIRVLRRRDTDEFRPIVFIAHSLGGVLVKEALNRAWTRQKHYEDILLAVKGCIFLGVPHRGAAIASWAKHATQLTKLLTLGFAGNTSFLGTLEPDSAEWIRISDDFVDRGKDLSLYTFYETKKMGNLMVVDKASAIMHLPNEECFAVQRSDHRTIARFTDVDDERFSLVEDAIYNVVRGSLKGKQQAASDQTIIFDLPHASPHFFGQVRELALLRDTLDPSKPGMKGVVLYGLAGSGKSQLVLNFIGTYRARYSAIFWVNASSIETTAQSFSDIATCIGEMWPAKDLPNPISRSAAAEKLVLSRLRSTIYSRWLLVIDSADDAETTNFTALVPFKCPHGSVIVTSIRRSAADQFEPLGFYSEEIDSLDNRSATQLLLHTSAFHGKSDSGNTAANNDALEIAKELHGIPLALEQAGVLIRKQIVTFQNFIEKYSKHYKILMAKRPTPGVTFYEKDHSVVAIISLLFSAVQNESPDSARLLQILCVLGRQSIPFELLKSLARPQPGVCPAGAENPLAALLSDETILLMCISTLGDVCMVKFQDNYSRTDKTISVHGLICRWIVDVVLPDHLDDLTWIVEGVLDYIQPTHDSPIFPYRPDKEPTNRPYLSLVDRAGRVALDALKVNFAVPSPDSQLARINRKLAYVYLSTGRVQDATRIFEACVELEREADPDSWPSTETNLELLVGLAVCRQKGNDYQAAMEALGTSLKLAESLFDYFDDRTAEISQRLKFVSGRQEQGLQQHKSVVVASTGSSPRKGRNYGDIDTHPGDGDVLGESAEFPSEGPSEFHEPSENGDGGELLLFEIGLCLRSGDWKQFRKLLNSEQCFGVNELIYGKTLLMHLLFEKTDIAAGILLDEKRDQINCEMVDRLQRSALFYAALAGHGKMIRRLTTEFGADPNKQNIDGQTPLDRALESEKSIWIINELLEQGAHPDIPDLLEGRTPFARACGFGELDCIRIFHRTGKVDINRRDNLGNSFLHRASAPRPSIGVLRQLVEWGVNVNVKNDDGNTALHVLLSSWKLANVGRLEEFCGVLLASNPDINSRNNHSQTVLHIGAAKLSDIDFSFLVNLEGADLNAADMGGHTPLMVAILSHSPWNVQVMLDRDGVDVNALDKKGKSALFHAIEESSHFKEGLADSVVLLLRVPGVNLGSYGHGMAAEYGAILFAAVLKRLRSLRLLIKHSLVETRMAIKKADGGGLSGERNLIERIGVEEHGRGSFIPFT